MTEFRKVSNGAALILDGETITTQVAARDQLHAAAGRAVLRALRSSFWASAAGGESVTGARPLFAPRCGDLARIRADFETID